MLIKLIEKNDEVIQITDLIDYVKKSNAIDECGAIYSFEGIMRGKEEDIVNKLILSTPDKNKTQQEMTEIGEDVKAKFGVKEIAIVHYIGEFYSGDPMFLVSVGGGHRKETLNALTEIIERVKFDLDFKKEEFIGDKTNVILSGG